MVFYVKVCVTLSMFWPSARSALHNSDVENTVLGHAITDSKMNAAAGIFSSLDKLEQVLEDTDSKMKINYGSKNLRSSVPVERKAVVLGIERDDYYKYEKIEVPCSLTRIVITTLAPGTGSYLNSEEKFTYSKRVSTKTLVTSVKEYTTKFEAGLQRTISAGASLPVKGIDVHVSGESQMSANFEQGILDSTTVEKSYETDYTEGFEKTITRHYTANESEEVVIFRESINLHGTAILSNVLSTLRSDYDALEDTIDFKTDMSVAVDFNWFQLKNKNNDCLALADNSAWSGKSVIPWGCTHEAGQTWRWEGNRIRSKLGGYYLAVADNSGSKGQRVIVYSKRDELGQHWEWSSKSGERLKSGKGHFLAVSNNWWTGKKVVVWSPTSERSQLWSYSYN